MPLAAGVSGMAESEVYPVPRAPHTRRMSLRFSAVLLVLACVGACGGGEPASPTSLGRAAEPLPMARILSALAPPDDADGLDARATLELLRRAGLAGGLDQPQGRAALLSWSRVLLQRLDPVWGGLLAWTPQRLAPAPAATTLLDQALALQVFARAWTLSQERQFRTAFERVDEYIQDQLRRPEPSGAGVALDQLGYRAMRRSRPAALPARFTVADYWQLRSAHDRRQLGMPELAGTATVEALATLAISYLHAAAAFGSDNYRAEAALIARALAEPAAPPLCEGGALALWLWHQLAQVDADSGVWLELQRAALDPAQVSAPATVRCAAPMATTRANALLAARAQHRGRPMAHLLMAAVRQLPAPPESTQSLAALTDLLASIPPEGALQPMEAP